MSTAPLTHVIALISRKEVECFSTSLSFFGILIPRYGWKFNSTGHLTPGGIDRNESRTGQLENLRATVRAHMATPRPTCIFRRRARVTTGVALSEGPTLLRCVTDNRKIHRNS